MDIDYKDFESQLKNLSKGISFLDKEAILLQELDLQMRIYMTFTILGMVMFLLGVVL